MNIAHVLEKINESDELNFAWPESGQFPGDDYNFFGLTVCFKSNSRPLLCLLKKSFNYFCRAGTHGDKTILFWEKGPFFCHLSLFSPTEIHFLYKTENGFISVFKQNGESKFKAAYVGSRPSVKPPLDKLRVLRRELLADEIFFIVDFLVVLILARLLGNYLLFHGAVLGWRGKGLLLAGETKSGKTTLSLSLAKVGFDFLSDEVACLERGSLRLYPFPKALCLRGGAISALPGAGGGTIGVECSDTNGEGRVLAGVEDLGLVPGRGALPLSYIFLLRGFAETTRWEKASARMALWYVLGAAFAGGENPSADLFALSAHFGGMARFNLWQGETTDAVKVIKKLVC